jgi:hypothetical protein
MSCSAGSVIMVRTRGRREFRLRRCGRCPSSRGRSVAWPEPPPADALETIFDLAYSTTPLGAEFAQRLGGSKHCLTLAEVPLERWYLFLKDSLVLTEADCSENAMRAANVRVQFLFVTSEPVRLLRGVPFRLPESLAVTRTSVESVNRFHASAKLRFLTRLRNSANNRRP